MIYKKLTNEQYENLLALGAPVFWMPVGGDPKIGRYEYLLELVEEDRERYSRTGESKLTEGLTGWAIVDGEET